MAKETRLGLLHLLVVVVAFVVVSVTTTGARTNETASRISTSAVPLVIVKYGSYPIK